MLEKLPPDIQAGVDAVRAFFIGLAGLIPTAALARLLWHRRLVRLGKRKFWSRDLVWEAPTAIFSAILGSGLGLLILPLLPDAIHDDPAKMFLFSNAVVGLTGWLGPRGLEVLLARVVERHFGGGTQ